MFHVLANWYQRKKLQVRRCQLLFWWKIKNKRRCSSFVSFCCCPFLIIKTNAHKDVFPLFFRYAALRCESRSLDFIGENIGLASHARVGLVVVVTLRKISGDVMRQQRKLRENDFFRCVSFRWMMTMTTTTLRPLNLATHAVPVQSIRGVCLLWRNGF